MSLDGHHCWVGALCDHNLAWCLAACHGHEGQASGNELHIRAVPAHSLGVGLSFSLIAEEEVDAWKQLLDDGPEWRHLANERCCQVQAVGATRLQHLLRCHLHRWRGHGDEETCAVDDLGSLEDGHVLLQVTLLVVVGGTQVRGQGSFLGKDGHCACARRSALVYQVPGVHTILLAGSFQLLAESIIAYAAHVCGHSWSLGHPLGYSDRVLGRSACHVNHIWLS
mmetsp:Transcript_102323/g.181699  ORF Transcript_102323/g.181699 Transcript_102323/m.181699 type:complete len:224 (+) Transcript_102323:484-1155(+)